MKKLLIATAIGLALLTWHTSCTQQPKASEAFTPIKVETPTRPAGQEDVIQLVTPKIDTVRVGFIGLGTVSYTHLDVYKRQGYSCRTPFLW